MENTSVSKLRLLLKSIIFIVLAAVAFNAAACGTYKTYKYRCAYKTSYVTYKWIPGFYRHCCWVPGHCVGVVHYKVHYKTYHVRCCNPCNSCSNSFFGWF